jgi:DNA mismatch endonuclease, patch repair protein
MNFRRARTSMADPMVATNVARRTSVSWASTEGVRRSMMSNRRADTRPEKALRSALFRAGVRFRKDYRIECSDLHVRVDLAIVSSRVAVFVDGCFWHRCPDHGSDPKTNAKFWAEKLDRNVARDRRVDVALQREGWRVVRCWEHEPPEAAVARVLDVLSES